ncbi:MAG TPA: FecR domain-containing protein [Puia sp.]|nr:FecR domain-containing protein [Puia sp.]
MKIPENIQKLMLKYILNDLLPNEASELSAWRQLSAENEELFQEETDPEKMRANLRRMFASKAIVWEKIRARYPLPLPDLPVEKPPPRIYRFLRVAAMVIIVVGAGLFFILQKNNANRIEPGKGRAVFIDGDGISDAVDEFQQGFLTGLAGARTIEKENGEYIIIAEPRSDVIPNKSFKLYSSRGGEFTLILPDSTPVWVNAETIIRYPARMTDDSSKLVIAGEAYVEMATDRKKPLLIVAGGMHIRTGGGRINISAYPGEATKATLMDGSMSVQLDASNPWADSVILKPGEEVQAIDGKLFVFQHADTVQAAAWKHGRTYFKQARLETIMQAISRWYRVDVQYSKNPPNAAFDLDLQRQAPISIVLYKLQQHGVRFATKGRTITVVVP